MRIANVFGLDTVLMDLGYLCLWVSLLVIGFALFFVTCYEAGFCSLGLRRWFTLGACGSAYFLVFAG